MKRELSLTEMLGHIDKLLSIETVGSDRSFNLRILRIFIKNEFFDPEQSHTSALLKADLGTRKVLEENARTSFLDLTGIDSRYGELPTKD